MNKTDFHNILLYKKYRAIDLAIDKWTKNYIAKFANHYNDYTHCIYTEYEGGFLICYIWDTREVTLILPISYSDWMTIKPKQSRCNDNNMGLKFNNVVVPEGYSTTYLEIDAALSPVRLKRIPRPTGLAKVGYKDMAYATVNGKGFAMLREQDGKCHIAVKTDTKWEWQAIRIYGNIDMMYDQLMLNYPELTKRYELYYFKDI